MFLTKQATLMRKSVSLSSISFNKAIDDIIGNCYYIGPMILHNLLLPKESRQVQLIDIFVLGTSILTQHCQKLH
jgi:hypothetical protein